MPHKPDRTIGGKSRVRLVLVHGLGELEFARLEKDCGIYDVCGIHPGPHRRPLNAERPTPVKRLQNVYAVAREEEDD